MSLKVCFRAYLVSGVTLTVKMTSEGPENGSAGCSEVEVFVGLRSSIRSGQRYLESFGGLGERFLREMASC